MNTLYQECKDTMRRAAEQDSSRSRSIPLGQRLALLAALTILIAVL